jgi:hypothetical protein
MYSIAKNIGLPATFVELRHQCTHEELPSLSKLQAAAERSLGWIWHHYWNTIATSTASPPDDECRIVLQDYLESRAGNGSQDEEISEDFAARLRKWPSDYVLDMLMNLTGTTQSGAAFMLESLRLSRALLSDQADLEAEDVSAVEGGARSLDAVRLEMAELENALQEHGDEISSELPPHGEQHDADMVSDNEDNDDTGWQMWKGPWVPKPIGIV